MERKELPIQIRNKWNVVLIVYSICAIIFIFWVVVLGSFRNQVIPRLVECDPSIPLNSTSISPCDLTNIGSSSIEVLVGVFIALLFFKLQKDHAEKLLKVERSVTKKIYARDIEKYACDFAFDEPENPDLKKSEDRVLKKAKKFLSEIEQNAKTITEIDIPGRGKGHELVFDEGNVKITIPEKIQKSNFKEGMYSTINIHLECENFELFDKIISLGDCPYWDLRWHVTENYDVPNIMQKMQDSQGKKPFSSAGMGVAGKTIMTNASYSLPSVNDVKIAVNLFPDYVGLTCVGRIPNGGFHIAHKKFKPEDLLSILFGEIAYAEVHDLLKRSIQK